MEQAQARHDKALDDLVFQELKMQGLTARLRKIFAHCILEGFEAQRVLFGDKA
jgi:hypothetical protein